MSNWPVLSGKHAFIDDFNRYTMLKFWLMIIVQFLFITGIFSQERFDYGRCDFDFVNYKNENIEFSSEDKIQGVDFSDVFQQVLDISKCFDTINVIFIKGQIIKPGSREKYPAYNRGNQHLFTVHYKDYFHIPSYEIIYGYSNKEIDANYFFNIYLDSDANIAGRRSFIKMKNLSCSLLDKEEAGMIVENKWKKDQYKIHYDFGYDIKKSCFAWKLSRFIRLAHDGFFFGEEQYYIINAHNGNIIYRKKEKLAWE